MNVKCSYTSIGVHTTRMTVKVKGNIRIRVEYTVAPSSLFRGWKFGQLVIHSISLTHFLHIIFSMRATTDFHGIENTADFPIRIVIADGEEVTCCSGEIELPRCILTNVGFHLCFD